MQPTGENEIDDDLKSVLNFWITNHRKIAWTFGMDEIYVSPDSCFKIDLKADEVLGIKNKRAIKIRTKWRKK